MGEVAAGYRAVGLPFWLRLGRLNDGQTRCLLRGVLANLNYSEKPLEPGDMTSTPRDETSAPGSL